MWSDEKKRRIWITWHWKRKDTRRTLIWKVQSFFSLRPEWNCGEVWEGGGTVIDNSQVNQLHMHNPAQAAEDPLKLSGYCSIQIQRITQTTQQQRQAEVSDHHIVSQVRWELLSNWQHWWITGSWDTLSLHIVMLWNGEHVIIKEQCHTNTEMHTH